MKKGFVFFVFVLFAGSIGICLGTFNNPYFVDMLIKRLLDSPGGKGLDSKFLIDRIDWMLFGSIYGHSDLLPSQLSEPECVQKLFEIMRDPENSSVPNQLSAITILVTMCTVPEFKHRVARVPEITISLLRTAIHPHKEISALSLMCLKDVLDDNPSNFEEFFAHDGLRLLSRCTRAIAPEVASTATETLTVVLPHLPVDLKKRFKLTPDECQSLCQVFATLGATYAEQGSHEMAKLAYESALKVEPNQPFLHTAYAAELVALHDYQSAADTLKRALALEPSNLEAVFQYYKTLKEMGKWDDKTKIDLIKTLGNCVESWGRLIVRMRDSPELMPSDQPDPSPVLSAAYNLLVRTCEESNRLDLAISKAQDWSLRLHTDAVSYFHYGRLLLKAQYYSLALQQLNESLQRDPSRIETHYLKSLCLYKLQRFDDAAESLQHAKEQFERQKLQLVASKKHTLHDSFPLQQASSIDLSQMLQLEFQIERNRDHLTTALECIQQFLRMKPSDCGMYFHSGITHQKLHQISEAYADFMSALQCFERKWSSSNFRAERDSHFKQHPNQKVILDKLVNHCNNNRQSDDDNLQTFCRELDHFQK